MGAVVESRRSKEMEKYWFAVGLAVLLVACSNQEATETLPEASEVQLPTTVTSKIDDKGNTLPGLVAFAGSAVATCTSVFGENSTIPSGCNINFEPVTINNSIKVTKTVYLTCFGAAPVSCAVSVTEQQDGAPR